MVYEYCNEIAKSGINRNVIPASCNSFMEMGLYCAEESQKVFNEVYAEIGNVELGYLYRHNTVLESTMAINEGKFIELITKPFVALWEGIKSAWEKILKFIEKKMQEFASKIGDKFNKINLAGYKDKISAAINKGSFPDVYEADMKAIEDLKKDIENNHKAWTNPSSGHINSIFSAHKTAAAVNAAINKQDVYSYCAKNAYGIVLDNKPVNIQGLANDKSLLKAVLNPDLTDVEAAKKYMENKVLKPVKVTYDWLVKNKANIYNTITTTTVSEIRKDYKDAKVAMDKAIKEIKSFGSEEETVKNKSFCCLKIDQAAQNCLLQVAQMRKTQFIEYIMMAGKLVILCRGKEQEVKTESTIYNESAVNKIFAE